MFDSVSHLDSEFRAHTQLIELSTHNQHRLPISLRCPNIFHVHWLVHLSLSLFNLPAKSINSHQTKTQPPRAGERAEKRDDSIEAREMTTECLREALIGAFHNYNFRTFYSFLSFDAREKANHHTIMFIRNIFLSYSALSFSLIYALFSMGLSLSFSFLPFNVTRLSFCKIYTSFGCSQKQAHSNTSRNKKHKSR